MDLRGNASGVQGLKLNPGLFPTDAGPQAPEGKRPANPRILENRAFAHPAHRCERRNQPDRYEHLAGDAEIRSVEPLLPDPNDRQDVVVRENGSANERRVSSERADPIPMAEDRNVRSTRRVVARQDRAAECCIDAKDRKVAPGDVLSLDTVCATLDLC